MIVRTLEEVKTRGGYRENPGVWSSARYLLRDDRVGFTVTQTTLAPGACQEMEYRHHIEANLIIEGQGEVTDLTTGATYPLGPGSMYTLDKHERHLIKTTTQMRIVCIFTPALVGPETHDEHGSYPPPD